MVKSFKNKPLAAFWQKADAPKLDARQAKKIHRILVEAAAVTPEMAQRIGKLGGNGPRFWLALQQAHDLCQAERMIADDLTRIETLRAA